jgi:UDP-N-acetylglucosamine 1-carboxyvinyltransferase
MMAASLLHRGISVLTGCPRIADVFCMEEILRLLGAVTWWEQESLYIDCTKADGTEIPSRYTGKMRSSVILLGVLLARNKRGCMGYPGGCVIGKRPVDLHLQVLKALGAQVFEEKEGIRVSCENLTGCDILFLSRSVGATEQGILAAVTAQGETTLRNCAQEPEIQWLCRYLRSMGADILGEGSSCIRIRGVRTLSRGNIQVPADRIVAGTYVCAAAAARGEICLENAPVEEMSSFLEVYRKMGGQYKQNSGKLVVNGKTVKNPVPYLETGAYPGFPTDLQSPVMAVLATIPGPSHICERIFEDRYKAAEQLNCMGARISIKGRDAFIEGGLPLTGCQVEAMELRGGAALCVAALAAKGRTVIRGDSYIRRGYAHICEDLCALGGAVREVTEV